MNTRRQILLTFDLEEFDLPLEFGCPISAGDQIAITNNGLHRLLSILTRHNITATFFTTITYADRNNDVVKLISGNHEIASHSNCHTGFKDTDLHLSKLTLERITGKEVIGFRMPRFSKVDMMKIKAAGYRYDSSINPTCIPGRYNNLRSCRRIYTDIRSNLTEVPVSVSPVIRFPLFWISFKNIPFPVYLGMCKLALKKDSYLHLYFHPWEFADIGSFRIPWYIKRISGEQLSERFEVLIKELKKAADFTTISGFLDSL